MKRKPLILAFLMLLGVLGPAPLSAAPPPVTPLTNVRDLARAPQTDGQYVVWSEPDADAGGATLAIYARSRSGGERITVATNIAMSDYDGGGIAGPALDRGTVVWVAGSELRARNLATGETTLIASGKVSYPAIAGSKVSWWEDVDPKSAQRPDPLPATLKLRDLATMAAPTALTQTPNTIYTFGPSKMSQDWVVWGKPLGQSRYSLLWELYAVSTGGGQQQNLGSVAASGRPIVDLAGEQVIYSLSLGDNQPAVRTRNLRTGETSDEHPQQYVSSLTGDGRYLFWGKSKPGGSNTQHDLWGFDTQTKSAFLVAGGERGSVIEPAPQVRNGMLAWRWQGDQGTTLSLVPLAELLPAARRSAPAPAAGQQFFPETGHALGGEFERFWRGSGGLPVFGFPLTDEFIEQNASSAEGRATQYLERQRFELHPENAGTPYLVLLGRLGVDVLAAQGRNWEAFPKADPALPHYFGETGHAIAPQFWDYWRSHGLEFGDAGVSAREALALFGYPVSEPQIERNSSGDEVLTQWFERARFEYHPANPAASRVLLGRLGDELLRRRGW
ncbi:MAG TPA: hypothetical protein VGE07_25565 [Herpetosiphonaceae bacterium]